MATTNPKPLFQPRVLRTYAKWAASQSDSIVRLQRWWRALKRLRPSNTVDCITLEPVEPPVFLHVTDTGHVTAFSATSLAQYMNTSGNFTHPQFRVPFTPVELWRLDKCTGQQFNLLQNRDRIQVERANDRSDNSLSDFLMNECMSFVQTGIEVCSRRIPRSVWSTEMRAITEPLMMALISFAAHNRPLARQMISQAIDRVEGHPANVLMDELYDDLNAYFDACDRCLQFSLLLNFMRSNLVQ